MQGFLEPDHCRTHFGGGSPVNRLFRTTRIISVVVLCLVRLMHAPVAHAQDSADAAQDAADSAAQTATDAQDAADSAAQSAQDVQDAADAAQEAADSSDDSN